MTDPRYRIWDRFNGVFWTRQVLAPNRGPLSGGCYVEHQTLAGLFSGEEVGGMRAAGLLTVQHEVRAEEPPPPARPLDGAVAEARHTCCLILFMAEETLLAHPAIQADPDWRGRAQKVAAELQALHGAMESDAA